MMLKNQTGAQVPDFEFKGFRTSSASTSEYRPCGIPSESSTSECRPCGIPNESDIRECRSYGIPNESDISECGSYGIPSESFFVVRVAMAKTAREGRKEQKELVGAVIGQGMAMTAAKRKVTRERDCHCCSQTCNGENGKRRKVTREEACGNCL